MNTGILRITVGESVSDSHTVDLDKIAYELGKCGHFAQLTVCISDSSKISDTFKSLLTICEAILVCGDVNAFYDVMSEEYNVNRSCPVVTWGDTLCVITDVCDAKFVSQTLIPALNSQRKTNYSTSVFRTFGKSESELRTILKDYVKNRNKISFKFFTCGNHCKVLVRYSNKMQKNTVQEMLSGVAEALAGCTYSYDDDTDLATQVAKMLMKEEKTLGLAESFTGGKIASSLVQIPGISRSLKEGIVCYSNQSKHNRLRVDNVLLSNYGAVSDEVAYEMAANLLVDGQYDYVIATTGNAGPTSEKPNEVGVCYVAVGNKHAIDVYCERFDGDRETVIGNGTDTALFYLFKHLRDDAERSRKQ